MANLLKTPKNLKSSSLLTGTVCDSLIRVDGLVEFATVEEILQQFLHLGNARRAADQHNVVDTGLVNLGVTKRLLHWFQRAAEQIGVQLLEPGASDARVEVDAFKQRIDLDRCLDETTNIAFIGYLQL